MTAKPSILSFTQPDFSEYVRERLGKGHIHAALIYEEFFRHGKVEAKDPAFNNCPLLAQQIMELVSFDLPEIAGERHDGKTGKFLMRTADSLEVESVLIPMQAGGTLCVSSQVGCRMGCTFCETGRMGLLRNLTAEEIISQMFIARHRLGFVFRNVVFMGMGEPLDNFDAVMQAVAILYDPKGFNLGRKQVTISTSGCIEGIEKLIALGDKGPNLAISINAPNDLLRNRIMPVNRKHNLAALREIILRYNEEIGRSILVAYVLMKEVNDSSQHAEELVNYLSGLNVKVNLIPYNHQSCDRFTAPEMEKIETFANVLRKNDIYTLLRLTKGKEIMAACGQLGNLQLRKSIRSKANYTQEGDKKADLLN